jgi:hypothetical protein
MDKKTAIKITNEHYQNNLLINKNVCFSNINKEKEVWWFDVSLKKLSEIEEINLLMFDDKSRVICHLCVPTDYFNSNLEHFKVRTEKNCISLELSAEKHMLFKDVRPTSSGLKFDEFLKASVEIN